MRIPRAAPVLIAVAVLSAGAGLLYALLTEGSSYRAGAIYGFSIGMTVSVLERGLMIPGGLQARIRRWPTLLYVPAVEAAYVIAVCLGFLIGGTLAWSAGLAQGSLRSAIVPPPQTFLYSLVVAGILVFVTRVRELLGRQIFMSFLLGRYHRPVEEERVFLFLDLAGSTAFARQHGDLRAQAYLGAVFATIAEPVHRHGGGIDDYIGDMAMITWPLRHGLKDAACIRCVFAIQQTIERDAATWLIRFGHVPSFHAALHGGAVVTAEIGVDRHKITYFGDVVNTTARIETLTRRLDAPVLISTALLARIPALPFDVAAEDLGQHNVHDHEQPLAVAALSRRNASGVIRPRADTWTERTRQALAGG